MAKTTANTSRAKGSGSFRDFERNNKDLGVGRTENLKIPLDRIFKKEGFNPRDLSKVATAEKIQRIKDSYKAGRYVPAIEVTLEDDDRVSIVNGECRYTAACMADAELKAEGSVGIPFLVCVPTKFNDADRLLLTINGNEGEKLTPIELAEVIKRFIGMGLKKPEIARMTSWSASYIDKLDFLSNMPHAVKVMVQDEKISVDVAMAAVKKYKEGPALMAYLEGVIAKAEGKKVTTSIAKAHDAAQGETESEEGGEGGDPAPTPTPAPKKVNTKKVLTAAQAVAYTMPEIDQDVDSLKDTKTYTLKVTGAAMKALIELQNQFQDDEPPPEMEHDSIGVHEGIDPEPPLDNGWPFQAKGAEAA